jgi:peptidoglycan/xylan/chitin deacetylase (PgdA/CDA1 family)
MNKFIFQCKVLLRRLVYLSLYVIDTRILHEDNPLFILCYHGIGFDTWHYGVMYETLQKQIEYLLQHYTPVTLEDIHLHIQGKKLITKPSFVVTFDDGYNEVLQSKSFFKRHGIQPAIFLLSNTEKANRKELDNIKELLTNEEILDLHKSGWTIGSHSETHSDFYLLTEDEIMSEVVASKGNLERSLHIPIHYFAYPKGRYTNKILQAVQSAGYYLGLTMDDGFITQSTHPYLIPRVGVNRTHTFIEFKAMFLPSSIRFRKFIKERIGVII